MVESAMVRVSRVLSHIYPDTFSSVPFDLLNDAAARGSHYHEIAKQIMLSRQFPAAHPFNPDDYQDDYHIVGSLMEWAEQYQVEPRMVEQTAAHRSLRYCGTPDLLCRFSCKQWKFLHKKKILIDFKFTAAVQEMNHMQLVAYWHLPIFDQADKAYICHIDPRTGAREMVQIFRHGNGHWQRFCQGYHELMHLQSTAS